MKKAFLYLVILTVTTSMALQISLAAGGNVKVRHTVIAATGDAAPPPAWSSERCHLS